MVFAGRNFAYFGELAETDNALLLPNRFHWCLPQRVRSRAGPREGDVPLLCARAKWMQPVATMTAEHHKLAIADAQEAKPFGALTGNRTTDADLFHLGGPQVPRAKSPGTGSGAGHENSTGELS